MRQEHFEKRYQKTWDEYNTILKFTDDEKSASKVSIDTIRLPDLYRKICNHYAVSLSRQYSPALVSRLHNMVLSGHKKIYKRQTFRLFTFLSFFTTGFPTTFRQNFVYFVAALLLFAVPAVGTGVSCYVKHDLIYSIMSDQQVSEFEYMYDPVNRKTGRTQNQQADSSVIMFGFYIKNNISIGFRTFAGGMLAGIGTLFFLVYNGILIGGLSGHVTRLGFTKTFWTFVSGHGAFELTAIVISGMAGLVIARAIISPGNYSRSDALKYRAKIALILILGAASMLLVAAFIEAFWSPSAIPPAVKYGMAAVFWGIVIFYFSMAGKRRGPI